MKEHHANRKIVPFEEFRRRRETHDRETAIAHAELAELAFESVGELPRVIKVSDDEALLSMRISETRMTFCFYDTNRVFVVENETVSELPKQLNPFRSTMNIALRKLDFAELDAKKLSKHELAEVAGTYQRLLKLKAN